MKTRINDRKSKNSLRGLEKFSIKKPKLTREIDPQRKQGLANVSGSLWPSVQTLVTQSSSFTNVTRKVRDQTKTMSAKEVSLGNLVAVMAKELS